MHKAVAISFVLFFNVTAFAGQPVSFDKAYHNAKQTGKPIIAVLGADWCPACVTLKNQTIPEAQRRGGLKNVELTHINIDHQKAIAAKLQRGRQIPQMIRMEWNQGAKEWTIIRFKGVPGVEGVQQFTRTEAAKPKTKKPATQDEATNLLLVTVQ